MKTYNKYINLIKKGKFTEQELISFRKSINGSSTLDVDTKYDLIYLFETKANSNNHIKLTKEQQLKGIEWLKRSTFKVNGEIRKNSPLKEFEQQVIKDFKEFKCVGLYNNSQNSYDNYVPIYRCYDIKGNYFDYACMMQGQIEILTVKDTRGNELSRNQPRFDLMRQYLKVSA